MASLSVVFLNKATFQLFYRFKMDHWEYFKFSLPFWYQLKVLACRLRQKKLQKSLKETRSDFHVVRRSGIILRNVSLSTLASSSFNKPN